MAVSFKSTKTTSLEASSPLLTNPLQATEPPPSSTRSDDRGTDRVVVAGATGPLGGTNVVPHTAERPMAMSLQLQPAFSGATNLCGQTWQSSTEMCPLTCPEKPLATPGLLLTGRSQRLAAGDGTRLPDTNHCPSSVQPQNCSIRVLPSPSQQGLHPTESNKTEQGGQIGRDHTSGPSSPIRKPQDILSNIPVLQPSPAQWPFTAFPDIDNYKVSGPSSAAPDNKSRQAVMATPLTSSDICYSNSTEKSSEQASGVLAPPSPFIPQPAHNSDRNTEASQAPCCPDSLELCGFGGSVDETNASVSRPSTASNTKALTGESSARFRGYSSTTSEASSPQDKYDPIRQSSLESYTHAVSRFCEAREPFHLSFSLFSLLLLPCMLVLLTVHCYSLILTVPLYCTFATHFPHSERTKELTKAVLSNDFTNSSASAECCFVVILSIRYP